MKSWLQRMAAGDPAPLEALYNRYGGALYSFALDLVRPPESAAAVVEEVFVRLWEQAGEWEATPGTLFGKLVALTRYHAQDRLRAAAFPNRKQEWGGVENPDAFGGGDDPAPGDKIPLAERAARVNAACAALPARRRELLQAAFGAGEPCTQLAARCELDRAGVARECRKALEALHEFWRDWMDA